LEEFLIDANVFLELELGQSRAAECKAFLTAVSKGELKAAVTDFTVDSVALVMESRGSPAADLKKFFESLKPYKGLSLHGLSLSTGDEGDGSRAAGLR
jgi:predicted nucleic acid-binding protein